MTKLLAFILILAMGLHLIRPLGLPGLKRRRDFWKLAAFALAAFSVTVIVQHVLGE